MLIAVNPDDLTSIESGLREASRVLLEQQSHLTQVYGQLDWQVRQATQIDGLVQAALALELAVANSAHELAVFVARKRDQFVAVDQQGFAGNGWGGPGAARQEIMRASPGTLFPGGRIGPLLTWADRTGDALGGAFGGMELLGAVGAAAGGILKLRDANTGIGLLKYMRQNPYDELLGIAPRDSRYNLRLPRELWSDQASLLRRSGLPADITRFPGVGSSAFRQNWKPGMPGALDIASSLVGNVGKYHDDGSKMVTAMALDGAVMVAGELVEKGAIAAGCAMAGPPGCLVGGALGKVGSVGMQYAWEKWGKEGTVEVVDKYITQPAVDLIPAPIMDAASGLAERARFWD